MKILAKDIFVLPSHKGIGALEYVSNELTYRKNLSGDHDLFIFSEDEITEPCWGFSKWDGVLEWLDEFKIERLRKDNWLKLIASSNTDYGKSITSKFLENYTGGIVLGAFGDDTEFELDEILKSLQGENTVNNLSAISQAYINHFQKTMDIVNDLKQGNTSPH